MSKLKSYNDIYETIISEINRLLMSLHNHDDKKLKESKESAISKLTTLQNELVVDLESLKKNADWDTFTIAFYGETNAGKSTLIETLRILLNEPSKEIERRKYQSAYKLRSQLLQNLQDLQNSKDLLKADLIAKDDDYVKIINDINSNIDQIIEDWITTQMRVFFLNQETLKVMTSGIIGFFKVVFKKLESQHESANLQNEIEQLKSKYDEQIQLLNQLKIDMEHYYNGNNDEFATKTSDIDKTINLIAEEEKKLVSYSDGKIINESSDFTKTMQVYPFNANNISFNILDLPGIEGKEDIVIDEIEKAIEKAHVIFYVSRKPHAPQNGGTEHIGTIDKIKTQLSKQSEVYFIYNKGIKNPRAIKDTLITKDEKSSLIEVDKYMVEALGNNYERHIAVSAYPAYIAICNDYNESAQRSKNSFLQKFSPYELLEKSNILSFSEWIKWDLIKEHEKKIIRSNFKKIRSSVTNTSKKMKALLSGFDSLEKKAKTDYENTCAQLNENKELLKKNITEEIESEIQKFINDTRKRAYKCVDDGISNKELTNQFKKCLSDNQNHLEASIQKKIEILCLEYQNEVSSILERYERYLSDLGSEFSSKSSINLTSSIKINAKSKGSIFGVLGSIAGIVIGILTMPEGGIVLVILGIIGEIISLGKEIYGFFDKEYKRGQQKKSIDENLDSIEKKLNDALLANTKDINDEIDETTSEIITELSNTISSISELKYDFNDSIIHLQTLSKTVDREEKYYEYN